jgi:Tol biopolymer transport system component
MAITNRGSATRTNTISSSAWTSQQRISNTDEYHFLVGMDKSKRYLIDSRADADTHPPQGIDGGDRLAIWVIDMQTMEERRLTDPKVHSEGDSFSPDAEWIVFLRRAEEGEQLDIYKIRRDGTELTQLTDTEYKTEGDPAWSNDETRIVFTEIDGLSEDPRFVLKTMNPDGGDVKILYDGGPGVPVPGVWPPGNYDPSWSPDDEWIVFERAVQVNQEDPENFGSGHWHIFKVRADGSQVVDLSLLGGHTDRAEYLPSFSPDGALIVYGSIYEAPNIEDSHGDIFVMDAEAGVAKRLTYSPYADMGPVFIGR